MPSENVREHKRENRYTFVVVSDAKSGGTRTFSMPRWLFFTTLVSIVAIIAAFVVAIIVYTPIGARLPISNTELSQMYGKKIVELQKQLRSLVREVDNLSVYNVHLRNVLGERVENRLTASRDSADTSTSAEDAALLLATADSSIEMLPEDDAEFNIKRPVVGTGYLEPAGFTQVSTVPSVPLSSPVSGYESRNYSEEDFHYGIDYAGKPGSPVLAAAEGIVVFSDWTYDYGYTLIVAHSLGFMTVYKHNQALLKRGGESVKRGEPVALLGNTGIQSYGPHLHFEVWKDGIIQNPKHYLISTK
jgi:murein DD-endopeptidase MepM/ murein hydrolase activator NlpD